MSEMVKRVARALWAQQSTVPWGQMVEEHGYGMYGKQPDKAEMLALARAAIASMREPTEAMVEAAPHWDCEECDGTGFSTNKAVWESMIDEALK